MAEIACFSNEFWQLPALPAVCRTAFIRFTCDNNNPGSRGVQYYRSRKSGPATTVLSCLVKLISSVPEAVRFSRHAVCRVIEGLLSSNIALSVAAYTATKVLLVK